MNASSWLTAPELRLRWPTYWRSMHASAQVAERVIDLEFQRIYAPQGACLIPSWPSAEKSSLARLSMPRTMTRALRSFTASTAAAEVGDVVHRGRVVLAARVSNRGLHQRSAQIISFLQIAFLHRPDFPAVTIHGRRGLTSQATALSASPNSDKRGVLLSGFAEFFRAATSARRGVLSAPDQPRHDDGELGHVEWLREVRLVAGEDRVLAILRPGKRRQRQRRKRAGPSARPPASAA